MRNVASNQSIVVTDDGIPLSVSEFGPADATTTVVFTHGFCLDSESWHLQRSALRRQWGDQVRMVFYDQRGHGQSGSAPSDSCTMDQLGADLAAVLRSVVPTGPVVLIGHSMGGMAVLSFARQNPAFVAARVVGVGLVATAVDGLTQEGICRLLSTPLPAILCSAARRAPNTVRRLRSTARVMTAAFVAAACSGSRPASYRVASATEKLVNKAQICTIASFTTQFALLDERAALPVLAGVQVSVICGSSDRVTPRGRSDDIAAQLPNADYIRVEGAGHMVILERPDVVSRAIEALVDSTIRYDAEVAHDPLAVCV